MVRYIKCPVCDEKVILSSDGWYIHNGHFYCIKPKCLEKIREEQNAKKIND